MTTPAMKKAIAKYDSKNTRQFHLKLNINTDAELIAKLDEQENKQAYLKELIRQDIITGRD